MLRQSNANTIVSDCILCIMVFMNINPPHLVHLAHRHGLTIDDIADLCDVARVTVLKWKSSSIDKPSMGHITPLLRLRDKPDPPPIGSHLSPGMRRRLFAHEPSRPAQAAGAVANAIRRKSGLWTPGGVLFEKPEYCQWTYEPAKTIVWAGGWEGPDKTGSSLVAHHLFGYNCLAARLTVIFVNRKTHAMFHDGRLSTLDVLNDFGYGWTPWVDPDRTEEYTS